MTYILADEITIKKAEQQLSTVDPVLAKLIAAYGPCTLRPHKNYYRELVESIIGQQLSVKAAESINGRFIGLFYGSFPEPEAILAKSHEELRSAGLSNAKARYIVDLARHVLDGKLDFSEFDQMSNAEITDELTAVKGIGEWTAHMFLLFCMGRLNILPTGDLGIRAGIQKLYGLDDLPNHQQIVEIAESNSWAPYQSVASWYIWKSLENKE